MRRPALIIVFLLGLAACKTDQPGQTASPDGAPAAAPVEGGAPADPKGRDSFTHCLDLTRERRYSEALTICREAEKERPGDAQLLKAIEMAEQGTGGAQ